MLSSIASAIAGYLIKAAFDALLSWSRERRSEATLREAGSLATANETAGAVNEIADKQASNNARVDDVLNIADELRREADAADGGGPIKRGK